MAASPTTTGTSSICSSIIPSRLAGRVFPKQEPPSGQQSPAVVRVIISSLLPPSPPPRIKWIGKLSRKIQGDIIKSRRWLSVQFWYALLTRREEGSVYIIINLLFVCPPRSQHVMMMSNPGAPRSSIELFPPPIVVQISMGRRWIGNNYTTKKDRREEDKAPTGSCLLRKSRKVSPPTFLHCK